MEGPRHARYAVNLYARDTVDEALLHELERMPRNYRGACLRFFLRLGFESFRLNTGDGSGTSPDILGAIRNEPLLFRAMERGGGHLPRMASADGAKPEQAKPEAPKTIEDPMKFFAQKRSRER